jgi:hypothetical protein
MKSILKVLMLVAMSAVLFTSCNENKKGLKELKELIEKLNNDCPVPLGDFGSINSVQFDGEKVEMKFTSNEIYAPVSSLSNHQQEVKEMLGVSFSKNENTELVEKIIATGVAFHTIFVGNQTGQRAEFTMTADEFSDALEKYSNMNDQQKLIVIMYIGSKIKLPIVIDNITKLVGLSLTSDALKYKYEVNDSETGQNIDSAVSFMKYITLSQMANSMKGGMMGNRNRHFYQALIDCNQGMEYEYHELQTGKRVTFRISTDEMKEVLQGKWDNQPSAQEWENLGKALDEFEDAYDNDSVVEFVDSYDDYSIVE